MSTIRILSGSYRNQPVRNEVFTLVKGYQSGKKGNYITVENGGQFPGYADEIKIKVNSMQDVEFLNGNHVMPEVSKVSAEVVSETDEQAMDRIKERFAVLDEMSKACINEIGRAHV